MIYPKAIKYELVLLGIPPSYPVSGCTSFGIVPGTQEQEVFSSWLADSVDEAQEMITALRRRIAKVLPELEPRFEIYEIAIKKIGD